MKAALSAASRIPLHKILRYPEAWPRFKLNPDRVSLFAGLYAEEGPDALPPVEVVPIGQGTSYILAEGWTRYEAAELLEWEEIPAIALQVPSGDDPKVFAFEHALRSCTRSSLPLTASERREAGRFLIEHRPGLTDAAIAERVGVDRTTALRWRHRKDEDPNGANAHSEGAGPSPESAYQIARRLFRGIEAVHGLGLANAAFKVYTGKRLADLFRETYGERALKRAQQFRGFLDVAISKLRDAD